MIGLVLGKYRKLLNGMINTDPAPYPGKQCMDYDGKNQGGGGVRGG